MTDLLIFEVDGYNHDIIQTIINEDNTMPTHAKLQNRDDADYGEYKSHIVDGYATPHTGPCWTSIYTGVTPMIHGLTSGGWLEGQSSFNKMNTIFDALSNNNTSMALFEAIMTYPAKKLNGWMFSGFVGSTHKKHFHKYYNPDSLGDQLPSDMHKLTTTYVAKKAIGGAEPSKDTETSYNKMRRSEERKLQIFQNLYQQRGDKDLVVYGTTIADKIGHIDGINEDNEYTRKTYSFVDYMLKELIRITDPDHVMILSDHGFSGQSHDLHGYYLSTIGDLDTIFDVAPTVLNHFGIEYNQSEYGKQDVDDETSLSEEEKNQIKDRLKDLGYM